jgi:hypothetical protein
MVRQGAPAAVIDGLLAGPTLRGLTDPELNSLRPAVAIMPSAQENVFHQFRTAEALLDLIPGAKRLAGCPEPPRPDFGVHLEEFLADAAQFAAGG